MLGCCQDDPSSPRRGPGRPRDRRVDEAILDAAGVELAEVGVAGFTVDGVAARAGVSKTTIYRRWPGRGDLLVGAARQVAIELSDPDTGSLRLDLISHLNALSAKLGDTVAGRLLPAMLAEASTNPEVRVLLAGFVEERRAIAREILHRGMRRGELPEDVDTELLLDMVGGPVFMRLLFTQGPMDAETVARSVDVVLRGFRA